MELRDRRGREGHKELEVPKVGKAGVVAKVLRATPEQWGVKEVKVPKGPEGVKVLVVLKEPKGIVVPKEFDENYYFSRIKANIQLRLRSLCRLLRSGLLRYRPTRRKNNGIGQNHTRGWNVNDWPDECFS